jgi:hypothetical protein
MWAVCEALETIDMLKTEVLSNPGAAADLCKLTRRY